MEQENALIPVSYVIFREGNKVLLQRRQGTGFLDGYWSNAAAGHVEAGESSLDAAIREAHEELGLVLHPEQLVPLTTMHRAQQSSEDQAGRVDFFYECTDWQGTAQIVEPEKSSALTWFELTELPKLVVPHERFVLQLIGNNPPAILTDQ